MSASATRIEHDQLFSGSGYLSQGERYRLEAITTGIRLLVYFVVATPWLMVVAR